MMITYLCFTTSGKYGYECCLHGNLKAEPDLVGEELLEGQIQMPEFNRAISIATDQICRYAT